MTRPGSVPEGVCRLSLSILLLKSKRRERNTYQLCECQRSLVDAEDMEDVDGEIGDDNESTSGINNCLVRPGSDGFVVGPWGKRFVVQGLQLGWVLNVEDIERG